MNILSWKEVLKFWFDPDNIPLHFEKNKEFDQLIASKFLATWKAGAEGLLVDWRGNIKGRLAEVIVLDQFSRNLWREDIRAYSQDKMALVLAQEAVQHDQYETLAAIEKKFLILPFMHSESLEIHDWACPYFEELGDESTTYFEKVHLELLQKFGRYPHRNTSLGRKSTPEEIKHLEERTYKF